jgi:hypothetical protein
MTGALFFVKYIRLPHFSVGEREKAADFAAALMLTSQDLPFLRLGIIRLYIPRESGPSQNIRHPDNHPAQVSTIWYYAPGQQRRFHCAVRAGGNDPTISPSFSPFWEGRPEIRSQ